MKLFKLRLEQEAQTVEFMASELTFRHELNRAFLALVARTHYRSAKLEVHHSHHGWNLVCLEHRYPIIDNPLLLDTGRLFKGVVDTLSKCDTWPTAAEREAQRQNLLEKEKEERALARRRAFFVVPKNK